VLNTSLIVIAHFTCVFRLSFFGGGGVYVLFLFFVLAIAILVVSGLLSSDTVNV
jgi:hypothetical protein